jgi:hypothetical protein
LRSITPFRIPGVNKEVTSARIEAVVLLAAVSGVAAQAAVGPTDDEVGRSEARSYRTRAA